MTTKNVFLSSTARDLAEYRKAAYKAIEGLDGYHCVRMEDFGARDYESDEFCRAKVAKCDLLVGIVGHLYGSCPGGFDQSYTEQEYEVAVGAGMSRLMFVAPKDFPVPADLIESDGKRKKQKAFRKRVNEDRIRADFKSPDHLATKITQAIYNCDLQHTSSENIVSLQPCFAHPCPLQKNFMGRIKERQMLTKWTIEGQDPILALIAMGGMGKSALTWVWLNLDVLKRNLPGVPFDSEDVETCPESDAFRPEGVFWWSFYEREANFIKFLDEILVYVSDGCVNTSEISSTYEKVRKLVSLLQERRVLIVLDGFERELCAYASLNAAYQGDEIEEDEKGDFRTCTERYAADFLRQMVALPPKSRLLLTSRLFPRELDGMAGCRREELDHLDHDDAVNFFRAHEIEGTRAQIQEACEPYEYHPLALRLLVGMILNDPAHPKDIIVASEYDPIPDLIPRENHIFNLAYNALRQDLQELLSRLAAFRSSMDYDTIKILSPVEEERELKTALRELVERGLLLFDEDRARYDFHRIVRSCAYERLANKEDIHIRLKDYFATHAEPESVESLDDLLPLIELYHHTIGAGQYDEACNLLHQKLVKPLDRLGAYQICIKLLRALFPDGEDLPPRLNKKTDQSRTLNALAVSYVHSGQSRRATSLWEIALPLEQTTGNTSNFAIGIGNLGYNQIRLGELKSADKNLQRKIELCHKTKDKLQEAEGHIEFSHLMVHMGRYGKAVDELNLTRRKTGIGKWLWLIDKWLFYAYQTFKILLMPNPKLNTLKAGLKTARNSFQYGSNHRFEYPKICSEWRLGAMLVSFASNKETKTQNEWLVEAENHLNVALKRCKQVNLVELEANILLTWARWHYIKGNVRQALQDAEEALYIADRYEYRLNQAEIHNFLARLALSSKDTEGAKSHAKTAYERAWCDGPPYCYKPALEEAEAILREIGAKIPQIG